jgi:ATPase subunit of ABC transporter with duplicated ATPase domains
MDEPTNHLDIHAVEALEALLSDCPCALLLVSHDKRFMKALTSITWVFEEKDGDTELRID